jgi:hypothetical protein
MANAVPKRRIKPIRRNNAEHGSECLVILNQAGNVATLDEYTTWSS